MPFRWTVSLAGRAIDLRADRRAAERRDRRRRKFAKPAPWTVTMGTSANHRAHRAPQRILGAPSIGCSVPRWCVVSGFGRWSPVRRVGVGADRYSSRRALCGDPARRRRPTSSGCSPVVRAPNAGGRRRHTGADGGGVVRATLEWWTLLLDARRRSESSRPGRHHGADVGRAQTWRRRGCSSRTARMSTRGPIPSGRRCSWRPATRGRWSCCACCSTAAPTSARRTGRATTALALAVRSADVEVVRFLVDKGLDPNALSAGGTTRGICPLRSADHRLPDDERADPEPRSCSSRRPPGSRVELLTRWIESGANVNASNAAQYGRTPLLTAVTSEAEGADDAEAAARSWRRPERSHDRRRVAARLGDLQRRSREDRGARSARRDAGQRSAARRDPAACARAASATRDSR